MVYSLKTKTIILIHVDGSQYFPSLLTLLHPNNLELVRELTDGILDL